MATSAETLVRTVDVVIVTFNSSAYISSCLDSLSVIDRSVAVNVLVVDNASADDTAEIIRTHPVQPTLVVNRSNAGFAAACNLAIQRSNAEFVLLLNPDAQLEACTLTGMLDYLTENPGVGIVGPRLTDEHGGLQRDHSSTGIFPGFSQGLYEYTRLHRLFPHHAPTREYFLSPDARLQNLRVAMVQGACFLFRRQLIDQIGALDERYFLYFEETDFCRRAVEAGWQVHYLGRISARHKGGHSMGEDGHDAYQFIRSMYLYHWKHTGRVKTAVLWCVLMPYHGLKSLKMARQALRCPDNQRLAHDANVCRKRFKSHFFLFRGNRAG